MRSRRKLVDLDLQLGQELLVCSVAYCMQFVRIGDLNLDLGSLATKDVTKFVCSCSSLAIAF